MLDTLAIARTLTDTGIPTDQAAAITAAVRQAAEHGNYVTVERLDAVVGQLEARLYRAMLVQAGAIITAVVAAIAGAAVTLLRMPGN